MAAAATAASAVVADVKTAAEPGFTCNAVVVGSSTSDWVCCDEDATVVLLKANQKYVSG